MTTRGALTVIMAFASILGIFGIFRVDAGTPAFNLENGSGSNLITSVPRAMTYQAILKDSAGEPVTDSVYTVTFRIFNVDTGGTSLWDATLPCSTSAGVFFTTLDNVSLPFDEDYWLELEIDGAILSPRQKISMVGYSARSDTSEYAATGGGWVDDGFNVHLEASYDKVGIGTSTPANKLHVTGSESVPILNVEQYGSHRAARFYSQNACALWVEHAGNHGLRVTEAFGDGVHIEYAGNNGITVDSSNNFAGYFVGRGYFSGPVGVATTSPQATLDVEGMGMFDSLMMPTGASDGYVLTSDFTGRGTWQAMPANADSDWALSDTNMYSGVSGNVGIGTATPGEKLEVNGNLKIGGKATIGPGNTNSGAEAFVAGSTNSATGQYSTVSGGYSNTAGADQSTVGGGTSNTATGYQSTVAGGYSGNATGETSTIGGGWHNTASGSVATVSGGQQNTASGNFSTIPGGLNNTASGSSAIALGAEANADHNYSFVWGDGFTDFNSSASRQFNIRASGGTRIFSNQDTTAGVTLSAGASAWSTVSDSALKRNIRPVDGGEILDKILRLPVSRWSYKAQDESIEHIGPMAQDFYSAFGLGEDEKHISTIDPAGVALAGVKELIEMVNELKAENAELESRIAELEKR